MNDKPTPDIGKLCRLVARLRAPDGCPWDREQKLDDLRAYLLEEAHEVAAAIDDGDWSSLRGELGDLLFQVVFIAALAEDEGAFGLAEVIEGVHAKMIERHPHVFGDQKLDTADAVRQTWERRKLSAAGGDSLLGGVPPSLPALTGAYRISQKVAGVGFDWADAGAVVDKVREELAEVESAARSAAGPREADEAVSEEIGDLLFAVASLARHLKIDPEAALARGNLKFRRRFQALEEAFASRGRSLADAGAEELEAEWKAVKRRERSPVSPR
ncbi:MAG: nucleoside triphosphate pyrophosphohydrolase [Thermoanaerobaculia bacterium]